MSKYTFERSGREHEGAVEAVLHRAAQDPAFRALALRDPHAAIHEETGVEVPGSFDIKFADSQGGNLTALWPDPASTDAELSDEDLKHAAGGLGGDCVCDMDVLLAS